METIEYSSETIRLKEKLSTERRFFLIIIGCLLLLSSILYVNFSNLEKESIYSYKEKIVVDTITFQRTTYDTIRVSVPQPITYYDTVTNDTVNKYVKEFEDSLLEGTLYAISNGELLDWGFYYKPLFPKYITTTITNTKFDTVKVKDNSLKIFLGAQANLSKQVNFDIYPSLSLHKNDLLFTIGYSPLNRSTILGLNIQLK